jgi:hypothetical protein
MKITKIVDCKKKLEVEETKPLRNIFHVPIEEHLRASKIKVDKMD